MSLTGRGLQQFAPANHLDSTGLDSVQGVLLPPWEERPCLKSIHDEEAAGFKMMNFLAGPCALRAFAEPEGSHPQWNDYLRSIDEAGLKQVLLKGTLPCNWTQGPFRSGTHHTRLVDAAKDLMNRKGDDPAYMKSMAELTAYDRLLVDPDQYVLTPDEWLEVCGKRIPKARGKAWFGISDSFAQLERNWNILSSTVGHIKTLQRLLKESRIKQ